MTDSASRVALEAAAHYALHHGPARAVLLAEAILRIALAYRARDPGALETAIGAALADAGYSPLGDLGADLAALERLEADDTTDHELPATRGGERTSAALTAPDPSQGAFTVPGWAAQLGLRVEPLPTDGGDEQRGEDERSGEQPL